MSDLIASNTDKSFKLKECADMLLAAGYFRARLVSLSPFDRIVGGISWAITSSFFVSSSILFSENSSLGDRVKLADSLVRSLTLMKCPHALQAHQIQGLDLDKIFPVIQWLVKQVLEAREVMGDLNRQYAVSQFRKTYERRPEEQVIFESVETKNAIENTIWSYKPKRKYRKPEQALFRTPEAHVEATLLEYGQRLLLSSVVEDASLAPSKNVATDGLAADVRLGERGVDAAGNSKNSLVEESFAGATANKLETKNVAGMRSSVVNNQTVDQTKEKENAARLELESKRLDSVAESLAAVREGVPISSANLEKIFLLQADAMKNAAESYVAPSEQSMGGLSVAKSAEQQHARLVENLKKSIDAAQTKHAELVDAASNSAQSASAILEEIKILALHSSQLQVETEKLDAVEASQSDANKEVLKKLKQLVAFNEALKKQEQQFKASCKESLAQLEDAIKKLSATETEDAEVTRLNEIEHIFSQDSEKHAKLRQVLAKKNQEIAAILRQMDDIPTRAELLQYERRFVELYTLVSDKLKETRKYYALYNTLADTRTYLGNEVSLLESISAGFPGAMKTQAGKEDFLAAFAKILDGVDKNISKVKGDLETEKQMLELKSNAFNSLVEQQRAYFKTVKQFQEECIKNENLSAMILEFSEQQQK